MWSELNWITVAHAGILKKYLHKNKFKYWIPILTRRFCFHVLQRLRLFSMDKYLVIIGFYAY